MSIVRLMLRISAIEALRAQLSNDTLVLDSSIDAIDLDQYGNLTSGQSLPFVSISTEKMTATGGDPKDLLTGGTIELALEAGITAMMAVTNPETGASEFFPGIPATDASMEFMLDMIFRDAADALMDADNEWADLWRGCGRIDKLERIRAVNGDDGAKLAAHRLSVTVTDLVDDPRAGEPIAPDGLVGRFLSLLQTSSNPLYAGYRNEIMARLSGSPDTWKITMARLGLDRDSNDDLGLDPDGMAAPSATINLGPGAGTVVTL